MKHILTFVLLLTAFMVHGQGLPIYYIGQPLPSDTTQRYLIVSKVDTNAINNHAFDSLRVTDFINMLNTYGIADSLPGDNFADSIYKVGNKILLRDGQGFVIDNDDDDTNELGYMNWYTGPPAILPTCSSSEEGDFLVNSFDGYLQYCDGSTWQNVTTINEIDTFYINGTQLLNGDSMIIGLWIDSTSNAYRITIPGSTDTLTLQRAGSGIDSLYSEVADAYLTNLDTIPKQTISIDSSGRTFIISQTAGPNIVFEDQVNDTLTNEEIEDIAGAMFTGNTETLITSTYDDPTGKVNLTVEDDLSLYDNSTSGFLTSQYWNQSGSNIYYNTGSVGIGTVAPSSSYKLDIQGGDIQLANIALGYKNSISNLRFGVGALASSTSSTENIAFGNYALTSIISGIRNVAIGAYSLNDNLSNFNIGIGGSAAEDNTTGNYNTGIGYISLRKNTTGTNNIVIGSDAFSQGTSISFNCGIGNAAGKFSTGNNNVIIGYQAGLSCNTGNVCIGYQAGRNSGAFSNRLYIDNSSTASPLIYGDFSTDEIKVNGEFHITDRTGGSATSITGADATNQIVDVTLGDKLELSSGTLDVVTTNYATLKMALPTSQDINSTTSTKINFDVGANYGNFTADVANDYITTSANQPVLINVSGQVRTTGTCTTAPPTVRIRLMSGTTTQVAEVETNASGLNYEHAFSITHIDTAFTTSDQYQVQVIGPSSSCPLKYQNVSLTITGL